MRTWIASALAAVACTYQIPQDNEWRNESVSGSGDGWSFTQAEISRQLSVDAYCGHNQYMTHDFYGYATGFIPTYTIYHSVNDVEGFIGYLPSDDSIYVVFKGSDSIRNWVSNLNTDKDKYRAFPECKCRVHDGFQNVTESVQDEVVEHVSFLMTVYPTAQIKTTGHSLGAAIAQLMAMALEANGIHVDQVLNFGQPRVGDKDYANFTDNMITNQWRHTHHKDIVPHVPPSDWPFSFHQQSTEVFEHPDETYKICGPGEDKNCSDQYLLFGLEDHLHYMGQCMGDFCGNCKSSDTLV